MLCFTHGGLRIGADCSTGSPWADCGLHFGHQAMKISQADTHPERNLRSLSGWCTSGSERLH
eukprot:11266133-Alexandrium_andersonii.AAC.1